MQRHLEKGEAIEVLDCTDFISRKCKSKKIINLLMIMTTDILMILKYEYDVDDNGDDDDGIHT